MSASPCGGLSASRVDSIIGGTCFTILPEPDVTADQPSTQGAPATR